MNKMDQQQVLFDERVTINKIKEYRSQIDDASSGHHSIGTYDEMVEEVERVSEMLMRTQSKLWQSQDELKTYNSKTKILQTSLEQREHENDRLRNENEDLRDQETKLRHEVERLNRELLDRDEGRARPELERRLRKAIDLLKKDLNATNEKYKNARDEIQAYQKKVDELQRVNKLLEESSNDRQSKAQYSNEVLATCQKQLRQANEENAILLEEVARLRDELSHTKKIVDQKDVLIRREVEDSVKEKIKLEVTKSVSKQVTERVTREVTSRMKAERDKELNSLREQIRKIVKENSFLQSKIDGAERMASEADALQQDVHMLTYEISRYEAMVDEAKQEYELRLAKLETDYRLKIQTTKDEATKEKWAHISEIRQQMAAEREREVETFTQRIEALSKQAERLLDRAEKEKEEYGKLVRKRAEEEWEREIKALSDKLDTRTKEKDQILRDVRSESAAYIAQERRIMEEEKKKEIGKYTNRIEILVQENDGWKKRIESLEEELNLAWEENRNYEEQQKRIESNLKHLEDENFKLKRKTQNLSTLLSRYKQDAEESMKELSEAKQLFREALLKSEGQNLKLKTRLQKQESSSKNEYHRVSDDRTKTLVDQNNVDKGNGSNNASADWWTPIKTENARLQRNIVSLESLLRDAKKEDYAASDEILLALEAQSVQLKSSITGMDSLFRTYRDEIKKPAKISDGVIKSLKEQLRTTDKLLKTYRSHQLDAIRELELARQTTEEALTLASEDDTVQLKHEIQTIEKMLRIFKQYGQPTIEHYKNAASLCKGHLDLDAVERLQAELDSMTSMFDQPGLNLSANEESDEKTGEYESKDSRTVKKLQAELLELSHVNLELESRVESLNYVLEKYRGELSKASQDLEHTRQTLALEGETAQKLSRRVESLNLLLDTTEQNHAENVRELAQSRLLLQEAAHASKTEIEKLTEEIKQINFLLNEKEQEILRLQQQSNKQKHEYEIRLREANRHAAEWKYNFERIFKENEGDHLKAKEEVEKSKRLKQEMIESLQQEIKEQHKLIENLLQAKSDSENAMSDLRKTLRLSEREKEEEMKRTDDLLQRARDENKLLLKKMEESEKSFLRALQQSEEERINLKKSLEDVKKTLLGQSYEESSNDTSSRRSDRSATDVASPAETTLALLGRDYALSSGSGDLSLNLLAHVDDFIVPKKKLVSWKDSDWDLDISTAATHVSHSSKPEIIGESVPINVDTLQPWKEKPGSPQRDDYTPEEKNNTSNRVDALLSPSPGMLFASEEATFEQTIRWKRNKSKFPPKETSWDDSTSTPPALGKHNDTTSKLTKCPNSPGVDQRIRNALVRNTSMPPWSVLCDQPRKKKIVSWNLETDIPSTKVSSEDAVKAKDSGDKDSGHSSRKRGVESREPTCDNVTSNKFETNMIDHREDMSDQEIKDFRGLSERPYNIRITRPNSYETDDESSTIDWNILQTGDSSGTGSGTSAAAETTTQDRPFLPSSLPRNSHMESLSSSFSYSSNGSSSECDIKRQNTEIGYLQTNSITPTKSSSNSEFSSASFHQRQSKSGCQRAREKALRHNWTKEELNQFISRTKTGPSARRQRQSVAGNGTSDEGAYSSGLQGIESRDTDETAEIDAVTPPFSEE